jgi:hypothetical protein
VDNFFGDFREAKIPARQRAEPLDGFEREETEPFTGFGPVNFDSLRSSKFSDNEASEISPLKSG